MKQRTRTHVLLAILLVWPAAACGGEGNGEADGSDVDDVTVEDVSGEEDPPLNYVTGRAWLYSVRFEGMVPYATSTLAAGADVALEGEGLTPGDFTDITDSYDCDEPWLSEGSVISCGSFTFRDIPLDVSEVMLRGLPMETSDPPSISKIFDPAGEPYQLLVLVSQDMIDAALLGWGGLTQDDANGMVVGVLAEQVQDTDPYQISGFIGGATVSIEPDPSAGADYLLVYYDVDDPADTSLESTSADESLFFILNVPPRDMSDPYTITIDSSSHDFQPARFAVEAGTTTYLMLIASP